VQSSGAEETLFQPTNESYIHRLVEASIDRHIGETEAERVLRQGQSYREGSVFQATRGLLASLGYLLLDLGRRLESANAPDAVSPRQQTRTDCIEISPS
jgi:hypothetical protein